MKSILEAKKLAKKLSKKENIQMKEALQRVAQDNGFQLWKDYKDSLDVFWYPKGSAFLNHWFVKYADAKEYQVSNGGYLLTYKGQYFVASKDYVSSLGIDPEDEVWEDLERDVSHSNALKKLRKFFE